MSHPKLYPFPKFPRASRRKLDPNTLIRYRSADHSTLVMSWMKRVGMQHLLHMHNTGEVLPDEEELSTWIYSEAYDRGRASGTLSDTRARGVVTYDKLARMAPAAAEHALADFDPDFTPAAPRFSRESASRGGKNSKRPRQFTTADLALGEGLGTKAAAAAIGCSVRTLWKLRAEAEAGKRVVPYVTGDEELDAYLAAIDAAPPAPPTPPASSKPVTFTAPEHDYLDAEMDHLLTVTATVRTLPDVHLESASGSPFAECADWPTTVITPHRSRTNTDARERLAERVAYWSAHNAALGPDEDADPDEDVSA
jgi:hypothetical protein